MVKKIPIVKKNIVIITCLWNQNKTNIEKDCLGMSCENHKPLQQLQRGTFRIAVSAAKGTKKSVFHLFCSKIWNSTQCGILHTKQRRAFMLRLKLIIVFFFKCGAKELPRPFWWKHGMLQSKWKVNMLYTHTFYWNIFQAENWLRLFPKS